MQVRIHVYDRLYKNNKPYLLLNNVYDINM